VSDDVRDDVSEREGAHTQGHARHDRLLVSRFAVGDTSGPDADSARSLVAQCTDCARLASDIALLQTSIAGLPTPKRTRNFRITEAQAEHLRGTALDRFLRRLAMPQFALVRPIAGVALAVGLVAAVVGAGLPGTLLLSAGAAAPAATEASAAGNPTSQQVANEPDRSQLPGAMNLPTSTGAGTGETDQSPTTFAAQSSPVNPVTPPTTSKAGATAAPVLATDTGATAPAPAATATHTSVVPLGSSQPTEFAPAQPAAEPPKGDSSDTTRLLLIYGGVSLATIAFALLLLSLYARRRTEDPLLR
jgi:hypothetical protein